MRRCRTCCRARTASITGSACMRTTTSTPTSARNNRRPTSGKTAARFSAPASDRKQRQTIAMPLKLAGYATVLFGKWNLSGGNNEEVPDVLPGAHGFDHWFGVHANHDQHTHIREKQPKADLWENGRPIQRSGFRSEAAADDRDAAEAGGVRDGSLWQMEPQRRQ